MSLFSSLYTGVSGIQSYGSSLQVIGDNIANIGTIGFKANRAEFSALLGQSLGGGASNIGRGVSLEGVTTTFAQGSFNNTERLTDLGIDGRGFFVVSDGSRDFYTRNGQFRVDNQGVLVTSRGLRVQGNLFDNTGQPTGARGDLQIGTRSLPPNPTSDGVLGPGVEFDLNLESSSTVPAAFGTPASVAEAEARSNYSTTITVYDSQGNGHAMTVYFRKSVEPDPGATPPVVETTWEWFATADGDELTGGTAGVPTIEASGTLTFDLTGELTGETTAASSFDFVGAAQGQAIGFDFSGTTQYASSSTVRAQSQDGFSDGSLASIDIGIDGKVTGFFTNGQSITIGELLLADFANLQGLAPVGGGIFADSPDSGPPQIGAPNSGGLGSISTFTLELSNVDLATEFVNLVTMQRAYQANTRIISTVDQLLSDVVNIVR